MELTEEQKFDICAFNQEVKDMTDSEVKQKLIEIYKKIIEQDNYYQQQLKEKWLIV